jgi:hypothetical protein
MCSVSAVLLLDVHHLQIWFAETLICVENKLFLLIRFYLGSFVFVLCQLNCLVTGESEFCIETKSFLRLTVIC